MEMEHLFGKVATPSDVGKLNRLVIPKQYAEKYFPLDSPTKKRGINLNFEDPNGKSWRFRYSYWTSSQSYVMTKGWSRFVKENKLHAGDLISFGRAMRASVGRLYINCRRRHHDVARPNTTRVSHFRRPKSSQTNLNGQYINVMNGTQEWGFGSVLNKYVRSSAVSQKKEQHDQKMPMILNSMQDRGNMSPPKHFRLFGVDVEFSSPPEY